MKTFYLKNKETIQYLLIILVFVWLVLILLSFAAEIYKSLFKVDPNDGVVTTLEVVGDVANRLVEMIVPAVILVAGLLLAPFVVGAAAFVAGAMVVIGFVGVVGVAFGWFSSKPKESLNGKINLD
jgi:hypothetical protein